MTRHCLALLATVFALAVSPAIAEEPKLESATVTLRDLKGDDVTTLTLSDAGNGILVTGTLNEVSPGRMPFISTRSASASRRSKPPAATSILPGSSTAS